MKRRLNGVVLFSLVSGMIASLVRWLVNPWFMDQPATYAFFSLVPLLALGWLIGPHLPQVRSLKLWALGSAGLFGAANVPPLVDPLSPKLVIVGIDGATWTVADQISLPNLEALSKEGLRGTLLASEPLFSPLLWTTLATGQPPSVHGIQGLKVRADQARSARFWEVARHHGMSVGLYKWLVTWPPPQGDLPGFTVPAWLAADAQTHPEDLSWLKEIELSRRTQRKTVNPDSSLPALVLRGVKGGLRWSTLWAGIRFFTMERIAPLPERKRDAFLRKLRVRMDRDVFIASLHRSRPDVASFSIYVTDALSHTHWSRDGGRYVHGAYRLADQVLGEIRQNVEPGTPVIVLSDHGFRNIGEQRGAHAAVPKIAATEAWIEQGVGAVDIVRVGRKLVVTPDVPVDDQAFEQHLGLLTVGEDLPLYDVDVFPDQSGWSLSIANVPPERVWPQTQVASRPLSDWVRPGRSEEGEHDEAGIVVLAGSEIEQGSLGEVPQEDLMPTVLALLGLPVAHDLPGHSWVPEVAPRVPSYSELAPRAVEEATITNEDRLKALGYID